MIIRVDSIENLTEDVANCLNVPANQMLFDISTIDFRMRDGRGFEYIESHGHEQLTDVYLCHLARCLNKSTGNTLCPLDTLLLTQNDFSDFLMNYDIRFKKSQSGEMILLYHNQQIEWKKKKNNGFKPARFSKRLSEDLCVNGFQFLYDIKQTTGPNYSLYMNAPEFVQDLDSLLDIGLVQAYREKSASYVALCKLPRDEVVFDRPWHERDFDTQYLYSALSFIWEYRFAVRPSGSNPILRALDQNNVYVERWIAEANIPKQH